MVMADSARLCARFSGLSRAATPLVILLAGACWASDTPPQSPGDLAEASLETLMNVEVSSPGRKEQKLSQAAGAVYVITQEDIRGSGLSSIPEVLRMVPGLQVARIDASSWSVTARGFGGRFADKMLVLIDGRSIYNHLYSGVYWEQNGVPLDDIERIEVIRGPGAAMWGSNAVNGVINVITKKTKDTRGDLITAEAGNQESGAGFRHGASFDDNNGSYRVYGKGFSRADMVNNTGQKQDDGSRSKQVGFRMDRNISDGDKLTLQGDAYSMNSGSPLTSNAVF